MKWMKQTMTLALVVGSMTWSAGVQAASPSGPSVPEAAAPATLTRSAREQLRHALSAYEAIRAALVADRGDVAASARALAEAADGARSDAPRALRTHLAGIATEARRLAGVPASDLPALRRTFGEVSRHLEALLAAEPSLARGLHVFECPMAEGYGRWIQSSVGTSNPYMGTRMPACGSEEHLATN